MEVRRATGPAVRSSTRSDSRRPLVVETAESAYKAGRQTRVPLMIGSNSADVVWLHQCRSRRRRCSPSSGAEAEAIAAYDPDGTTDFATLLTMVSTDRVQAEPARFTASAFVAKGAPAYVYRFSYVPASMREQWRNGCRTVPKSLMCSTTLTRPPGLRRSDARGPGGRPDGQHLLGKLRQDRRPEWSGPAEMAALRSQQGRDPRVPARRFGGRRPRSPESAAGRDRRRPPSTGSGPTDRAGRGGTARRE